MWDGEAQRFVDNTEMLAKLLSTVVEDYGLDFDSAFMRSTRATPRPSATRRGKPRAIPTLAESSASCGRGATASNSTSPRPRP